MVHWAGDRLKKLGAEVEYANVGMQELPNGTKIPLPPVLMGSLGKDPQKKTLLVYGHLDVQPALREDGWDYEPFVVRLFVFQDLNRICRIIRVESYSTLKLIFCIKAHSGEWQALRQGLDRR